MGICTLKMFRKLFRTGASPSTSYPLGKPETPCQVKLTTQQGIVTEIAHLIFCINYISTCY